MANENVKKFEELLRTDEELQAKLKDAAEAYEGAKDDAQAFFEATVGKLAGEAGLPFTFEEGRAFATENTNLDDSELEAVAGGGYCLGIGYTGEPDADGCWDGSSGGGACAYIGVGGVGW